MEATLHLFIRNCFDYGLWTIFLLTSVAKFDVGFYLCEQLFKIFLRIKLLNMEHKRDSMFNKRTSGEYFENIVIQDIYLPHFHNVLYMTP